jgi:hypothetical protein
MSYLSCAWALYWTTEALLCCFFVWEIFLCKEVSQNMLPRVNIKGSLLRTSLEEESFPFTERRLWSISAMGNRGLFSLLGAFLLAIVLGLWDFYVPSFPSERGRCHFTLTLKAFQASHIWHSIDFGYAWFLFVDWLIASLAFHSQGDLFAVASGHKVELLLWS